MKNSFFIFFLFVLSSCWAPSPENTPNKQEVVESMVQALHKQHPDTPGIRAQELSQMLKDSSTITLIDVRTPMEIEVSTLPNALSKESFQQLKNQTNQLIVAYDTFGYRAIEWVKAQKNSGPNNLLYLEGGVIAWAHANGNFIDPDGQKTQKVHVLNEAWALLPESYEAISE